MGDIVFVPPSEMQVTEDRDCFLNPQSSVLREKSAVHSLRLTRLVDGFHVVILAPHQWTVRFPVHLFKDWFRVISLSEEYHPQLDIPGQKREIERNLDTAERLRRPLDRPEDSQKS